MCVCLLLVRARVKIKGNKYGATRSAGDYRRKVQLARLCALVYYDRVSLLSLLSTRWTSHTVPPIVVTKEPLEWTEV